MFLSMFMSIFILIQSLPSDCWEQLEIKRVRITTSKNKNKIMFLMLMLVVQINPGWWDLLRPTNQNNSIAACRIVLEVALSKGVVLLLSLS